MDGMDDCPSWVSAVFESLSVESDTPDGLKWLFDPLEQQLIFAPSVLEIEGGPQDGEEVFPTYSVELHSIFMLFDTTPAVFFSTREGECNVEGEIDGEYAWITFQTRPFGDDTPSSMVECEGWSKKDD